MIKRDIADRYAKAVFLSDKNEEILQQRLRTFNFLIAVGEKHPDFVTLLRNPFVPLEEKKKVLDIVMKDIDDDDFVQVLLQLLKKGRWHYLTAVAESFRELVDEHLGVWEAELITGVPMAAPEKEALRSHLESFYNKKIVFDEKIDDAIIGGTLLLIGNHYIDWSVRGRMERMKSELLTTR